MRRGDVIDERFRIEALAGEGGMGLVYRAVDSASGDTVALKILHSAHPNEVARFAREVELLAGLRHRYVVRYVAHGLHESRPFLVTEWLEGEELAERVERGRLGVLESLMLGRRLAEALGAAHARGIVHRDVKPRNVMLVGGSLEEPRLLDFGVARVPDARELTATGAVVGTPGYLAPEQARADADIDARADVFALGAVLFKCLTGERPIEADDPVGLVLAAKFVRAPRVRSLRPIVPEPLDDLVARMLAHDRADRPADGDAVARALAEITRACERALAQTGDDVAVARRPAAHDAPTLAAEPPHDGAVDTGPARPPAGTWVRIAALPVIAAVALALAWRSGDEARTLARFATSVVAPVVPASASRLVDCERARDDPRCQRPNALEPGIVGEGPSLGMLARDVALHGGVVIGTTLFLGLGWGTETARGLVVAVDLGSGARRIVSGEYDDAGVMREIGSGPALHWVRAVASDGSGALFATTGRFNGGKRPVVTEGKLAHLEPSEPEPIRIVRIDSTSGARTIVWDSLAPSSGRCMRTGSTMDPAAPFPTVGEATVSRAVKPDPIALAIDDAGFLLAIGENPAGTGYGIVRIAKDGTTCAVVSATKSHEPTEDRGAGPVRVKNLRGLVVSDGALWGLDDHTALLVRVDLATGDRRIVSTNPKDREPVGAGPELGRRALAWDPTRGKFWTTGAFAGRSKPGPKLVTAVDPVSGDRTTPPMRGPLVAGGLDLTGGLWVAPDGLIVVPVDGALVRFDPDAGDSNVLSN